MVNFTIDGKNVEVPIGTTVLEAAKGIEIQIPTLCNLTHLEPYGGCRLCVVEVEGVHSLQTSCTLQVRENMVIRTDTEKVRAARKFILTMLFSDRNHLCPYCVVGSGDCELQKAAYQSGMTHWPLQPFWKPMEIDASHQYFIRDPNRCIMCRRCVRSCGDLVGNYTLGVKGRGADAQIIADLGSPLGESSCISCGTCVQVCPTGSIFDRWSAYRGQLDDLKETRTICIGCSLGCGIQVLTSDNHLIRIEGDWEAPVNKGLICKIGRFLQLDDQRERILSPLVRKDGELVSETWDKALEMVAERLKPLIGNKENEVDGIAAMVSTRLPIEAINFFKEIFSENSGSSMVTTTEEGKFISSQSELPISLGKPLDERIDIINDADCVILINSDLKNDHEVISFFIKRNVSKGQKLIVIDQIKNPLADIAAHELYPANGSISDVLKCLLAAMAELGLAKSNLEDQPKEFLEHTSVHVGIETENFYDIAKTISAAENPIIIFKEETGKDQYSDTLIEFSLKSRILQENGKGLISIKGQASSLAAAQFKLDKPFQIDGHQVVYIALGDEEQPQDIVKKLEGVPFLIVQASHYSKLTSMADIILPVETWAEQEGHFLNMEGRLQKSNKSLSAPEMVWPNEGVFRALAAHLGIGSKCRGNWRENLDQGTSTKVFTT